MSGGHIIDISNLDLKKFEQWSAYYGVEVIDGAAIVYKAVDDDLKSARGFAYPIGETVECPDWMAGDFCGNGLHLSPLPIHAQYYFDSATRFLKCSVPIDGLSVVDGMVGSTPKLKAKTVTILAEVTIDGVEVAAKKVIV